MGYSSVYTIKKYAYDPGKIYGYSTSAAIRVPDQGFVKRDQRDTASLDLSGNIITNKAYKYDSITNTWKLSIVSNFIYDNRESPFLGLTNFKTFGVFPNGETFFMELPQKNNRITQNEVHSLDEFFGGTHYNYSYSNIYNANGLLKEVSIHEQATDPAVYYKIVLVYKTL